jgi:glutaredoxin 3
MAEVVIYTTQVCPYCTAAKALFRKKGVAYREVDVSGDAAQRAWLLETTGQRTVPQIFIGGKSYGGFSDVSALEERGELDVALSGA